VIRFRLSKATTKIPQSAQYNNKQKETSRVTTKIFASSLFANNTPQR
jgi:hypothetical protein